MNPILDKERDYEEKMMDALLKHAAEVAESELLDEATDETPVEFSARHEAQMEALFKSVRPEKPRLLRPKRILVLVAALIMLFAVGTVALKPTILNFFLKTSETNTEIRFGEEEPQGDTYETEDVTLGYVPAGMQMVESNRGETTTNLKFQNLNSYFQVRIQRRESTVNSDNENSNSQKVLIQGQKGFIQERDGNIFIIWTNELTQYTLFGNLTQDELLKIAENIK